jgi:hypothetical protein
MLRKHDYTSSLFLGAVFKSMDILTETLSPDAFFDSALKDALSVYIDQQEFLEKHLLEFTDNIEGSDYRAVKRLPYTRLTSKSLVKSLDDYITEAIRRGDSLLSAIDEIVRLNHELKETAERLCFATMKKTTPKLAFESFIDSLSKSDSEYPHKNLHSSLTSCEPDCSIDANGGKNNGNEKK